MDQNDIPPTLLPRVPIPSQEEATEIAAELNANARRRERSIQATQDVLEKLPRISEEKLKELGEQDSSCPICFNTYLAIIAEEEMAMAMDSVIYPIEELGVTKLNQAWQCGHMFCRRDIVKWVKEGRRACPMCRRALAEPIPGEPEEVGEAAPSFAMPVELIPVEVTPEMIITARHFMNADFTTLVPDPEDPNPPPWTELRRRFLASNSGIPAEMLDRLTTGEIAPPEQRNPVWEEYPPPGVPEEDPDDAPPSGMYS